MKTKLLYANLTFIVCYLGTDFFSTSNFDLISDGSLFFALWYNWEVLKILKGQPSRFRKVNLAVGVMTLLFGTLVVVVTILRFISVSNWAEATKMKYPTIGLDYSNLFTALITLSVIQILLYVSILFTTIITINLFSVKYKSHEVPA